MRSFEKRLRVESETWVRDGLIREDQRISLLERHPVGDRGGSRFVTVLALLGGALVIAGIALIISSNWRSIGDWTKIVGLVALLIGAHGAGWRLAISPGGHPRWGEALFLVGGVLFLLGIALVSQIFHLNSRPPNGVLLWAMGISALPWILRSRSVQVLSVGGILAWYLLELVDRNSWLRLLDGGSRTFDGMPVLGVVVWLALTVALSGLALRRSSFELFAPLHERLGVFGYCVALYALSFTWSRNLRAYPSDFSLNLVPVVIVACAFGLMAALAVRADRASASRYLAWFGPGLAAAAAFLFLKNREGEYWLAGMTASVALFLANLGMIREGLSAHREEWINLGFAFIALNILTRYFLLFGTMLQGGVFFVVSGVIIAGLGIFLERRRRAIRAKLREGGS